MNSYARDNTVKYPLPKELKSPKAGKARIASVGKEEIRLREAISKSRKLFVASLVLVVFSMSCVIAFNALVSSRQIQLDMAQQQLGKAVIVNQNLNTEKAVLNSPARIVKLAQNQLKMSDPTAKASLRAVNPYLGAVRALPKSAVPAQKQKAVKTKKSKLKKS